MADDLKNRPCPRICPHSWSADGGGSTAPGYGRWGWNRRRSGWGATHAI